MNQILNLPRPTIFAHRGASAYAPENTLAAISLAYEQGAHAVELDAKCSNDGEVVVIHDPTLERTTDGKGLVQDMNIADLKKLDAGSFFSPSFKDQRIPTLSEVFETVGKRMVINIELANYKTYGDKLADRVADLVKRHNLMEWVLISSFEPRNLIRFRTLLPTVPVAILVLPGRSGWLGRSWLGRRVAPDFIHPYTSDVNAKVVEKEHARKRKINVWTVDDPEDMRRLFKLQVDGIFTDDPRLAKEIVKGKKV